MKKYTKKERQLLKEFLPAVNAFREAIIKKFLRNEVKYNWGNKWLLKDWQADLQAGMKKHLAKGDPIDMGVFGTMALYHGWPTAPAGEAVTITKTKGKDAVEAFVRDAQVDGAILYYTDGPMGRWFSNWRNDIGKEWVARTAAQFSVPLPQQPLPAAPEDDYTTPVKRYIVDYTTGTVLDEVESTSTVAGMVGSGLVGKFLERAAQFPDHYLALATSAQLPGPPLGVSEAEYPNLYLFKLATHNWEKIIQPYVEFANSRGYYVDAHASGKQLYMDAMGINMAYVGPESLKHARALRNDMNMHSTIQAHRVTVQKGRPEDIMSPEQLAAYVADGGPVVRKEEYTPNVTPELLSGAQVHSGDAPPFNPATEFTYPPVIYIEGGSHCGASNRYDHDSPC